MSAEDILVGVEIDTKPAQKGVEGLNSRLAANVKQTKAIQKELQRLEKEYKSIATAANKLPKDELPRLEKQVKGAEKASAKLNEQFDRTSKKLERVRDRTIDVGDTFAVLSTVMLGWGKLNTPIRLTNQIVKASQAILTFNKTVIPFVQDTTRLLTRGWQRSAEAVSLFADTFRAGKSAITDYVKQLRGYHMVLVRGPDTVNKFNAALTQLSRGASHVNRGLVGIKTFLQATDEGMTRVSRLFRTSSEGARAAGKIFQEFGYVVDEIMRPRRSVGAAGMGPLQRALLPLKNELLEVQYRLQDFQKAAAASLGKFGAYLRGLAAPLATFRKNVVSIAPAFMLVGGVLDGTEGPIRFFAGPQGPLAAIVERLRIAAAALVSFVKSGKLLSTVSGAWKTFGAAASEAFSSFGPRSAGAAQLPWLQRQLLILQDNLQVLGKAAAKSLGEFGVYLLDAGKRFAVFSATMLKAGIAKGADLLAQAIVRFGPSVASGLEAAKEFATFLDMKLAKAMLTTMQGFIGSGSAAITAGQRFGVMSKGIIGAIEATQLAGPAFLALGYAFKQSDSAILSFAGNVAVVAGTISLVLAANLTIIIGLVSSLATAIGNKLLAVMDKWEEKFVKAQQVTRAFEFTIRGFGSAIGETATGSLAFWNEQVEAMSRTTTFGTVEVQKAIKILIAEGANLGITAEHNAMLLKRAADIAAVTGTDIAHVGLAIARAMAGNGQSLQDLGVFTDEATLAHSKYAKAQNLVVGKLDKTAKAQLVMNVIMEQSAPIVGAATDQLNTIAGANKQYEQSVESLQAKLGSQNQWFVGLTKVQAEFFAMLNALPTPLLDFISSMVDVAGVVLKVTGVLIGSVLTIATLKSLYDGLNFVITKFTFIQTAMNLILGIAAKRLGVEAVAVVSLRTAMIATGQVAIPAMIASMKALNLAILTGIKRTAAMTATLLFSAAGWKSMGTAVVFATRTVWGFTASILKNPLFLGGAAIVGAVILLSEAIEQLNEEMEDLTAGFVGEDLKKGPSLFDSIGDAARIAVQTLVFGAKVIVVGWRQIYHWLELVGLGFKKMFAIIANDKDGLDAVNTKIDIAVAKMDQLSQAIGKGTNEAFAAGLVRSIDAANSKLSELTNNAKGFSEALKISKDAAKSLEIDVLGDEVDRAKNKFEETLHVLNNLRNIGVIKIGTEIVAPTAENLKAFQEGALDKEGTKAVLAPAGAGDISKAAVEAERARLDLVKMRRDVLKDLGQTLRQQNIEQLEATKKEVEAIRARGVEELRVFNEKIAMQAKLAPFLKEETRLINRVREAIKARTAAAVATKEAELAKERAEALKKEQEEYKKLLEEVNALIAPRYASSQQIIAAIEREKALELDKLSVLREQLKTRKEFLDEKGNLKPEISGALSGAEERVKAEAAEGAEKAPFQGIVNAGNMVADSITGAMQTGTMGMVTGMMGAVGAIIDAISAIMDMVPNFINKIADFINKVTDFPKVMSQAVGNLMDALLRFVQEAIPNIFKGLTKDIDKILTTLFDKIPEAVDQLFENLPKIITDFLKKVPEWVQKFVTGFIESGPRMMTALINFLINESPNITKMMFRQILIDIPKAIIRGIRKGLENIGRGIWNFLKGQKWPKPDIGASMQDFAKNVTNESSKLFKVLDLEARAAGVNTAKEIEEAINRGVSWLLRAWRQLIAWLVEKWHMILDWINHWIEVVRDVFNYAIEGLTNLWNWVNEKIVTPLVNGLNAVWLWVDENIVTPLEQVGTKIWDAIKSAFDVQTWTNMGNAIMTALANLFNLEKWKEFGAKVMEALANLFNLEKWKEFGTKVMESLANLFNLEKWRGLGTSVWDGLKSGLDNAGSLFSGLGTKIWDSLKSGLANVGSTLQSAFDSITGDVFGRIFQVDYKGKGKVEEALGIDVPFMNFARGGTVPGSAMVPGDSILNDKILAMLSPGEAVIPRSLMNDPAVRAIVDAILEGYLSVPKLSIGGELKKAGESLTGGGGGGGGLGGAFGDLAKQGKQGFEDLGALGQESLDALGEFLGDLDPSKLWDKVFDKVVEGVWEMFKSNRFHQGGLVGFANGGEVPAVLQSGEFVLNRPAVQAIGTGALARLNQGTMPSSQTYNFDITLNVDADGIPDEAYVRQRLIPAVKKELKDASMRGEFVMSERGLRKA